MIAELAEITRLLNYFLLSKDVVYFTDIEMSIIDVNPQFEELFKFEKESVVGKNFVDLIVREDFRDDFRLAFNGLKHNIPTDLLNNTLELYFLDRRTKEIPVELFFKSFVIKYNIYFLFIVKDATERLSREDYIERQIEDLEFAKEQLEEALLEINENKDKIEDFKLQIQKNENSIVDFIKAVDTNSDTILNLIESLKSKIAIINDESISKDLNNIKFEMENMRKLREKYHLESILRTQ